MPWFKSQNKPSKKSYFTKVLPCSLASALDIGLSNLSLKTITLTFYTMCKSSVIIFVLFFAFAFGLERVRFSLILVVLIISFGVLLMVSGEVDFVLVGFIQVIAASAMSGVRWSMTQVLIEKAKLGMNNPILTLSYLTPIMGIFLAILSLIFESPITELPKTHFFQTFSDSMYTILLIGVGGLLATMMILSEFFLISQTSVLTLAVVGILKEVVMITVAVIIFGDKITFTNSIGLVITIFGIALYNYLKVYGNLDMVKRNQPSPSLNRSLYTDNEIEIVSDGNNSHSFELSEYNDSSFNSSSTKRSGDHFIKNSDTNSDAEFLISSSKPNFNFDRRSENLIDSAKSLNRGSDGWI
ncbi:putative sugar phosphate/phosphate translocator [Smittium culicis]|uniref:Putative sugar phosphate/phosphate translocator n=1 Tax=Smittium culicis TaxID=133412 RepID=A0A1R1X194_9FUNG|nr:putative sugar phosphate/phosphate translocator [Smittium culicis]